MEIRNLIKVTAFVLFSLFLVSFYRMASKREVVEDEIQLGINKGLITSPTSMRMYELIEKYSDKYDVPKYIAYNVAFKETRYQGPFHWNYNPSQVSCVGALGPMQIMPGTAKMIAKKHIDNDELMNNLKTNMEISMKLLNNLYKQYKSWSIACGCYNTGRPIVNEYALFCVNNKDYRRNWKYIR
jgi:soluble lytic murein transglycosylase-like protein